MGRWLIQCLTVVTMLASIVHAQCQFACSIESPAHAAAVMDAGGGEHSCCPHEGGRKNQTREKPCPTASPAINLASTEASAAASALLPVTMLDQAGGALLSTLNIQSRLAPAAAPDSATLSLSASVSILRI